MLLIRTPQELSLLVINQRKKLKLSQAEVGNRVGVRQQTISDFENYPEGTKLETLFNILSAVNLDIKITSKGEETQTKTQWKEEW